MPSSLSMAKFNPATAGFWAAPSAMPALCTRVVRPCGIGLLPIRADFVARVAQSGESMQPRNLGAQCGSTVHVSWLCAGHGSRPASTTVWAGVCHLPLLQLRPTYIC